MIFFPESRAASSLCDLPRLLSLYHDLSSKYPLSGYSQTFLSPCWGWQEHKQEHRTPPKSDLYLLQLTALQPGPCHQTIARTTDFRAAHWLCPHYHTDHYRPESLLPTKLKFQDINSLPTFQKSYSSLSKIENCILVRNLAQMLPLLGSNGQKMKLDKTSEISSFYLYTK